MNENGRIFDRLPRVSSRKRLLHTTVRQLKLQKRPKQPKGPLFLVIVEILPLFEHKQWFHN